MLHKSARFNQWTQKHGENVEGYIRSLHKLADKCDFSIAKNENIRDRLVIGVLDKELTEIAKDVRFNDGESMRAEWSCSVV